ncbi:hypothetical protein F2Q70_00036300 [Brassica cretica]|uniref:Uncharacterized protein n=1 Tax=Brassica cretica TaxID=69181 RepID=A0A8S9JQ64_BRACR|nr:hypothetical protein F2Q70_00036300 [Brassica cretica]
MRVNLFASISSDQFDSGMIRGGYRRLCWFSMVHFSFSSLELRLDITSREGSFAKQTTNNLTKYALQLLERNIRRISWFRYEKWRDRTEALGVVARELRESKRTTPTTSTDRCISRRRSCGGPSDPGRKKNPAGKTAES